MYFVLAMSATPYRKDQDEAFGKPDIEVSYREAAVKEGVLKRLECHSLCLSGRCRAA